MCLIFYQLLPTTSVGNEYGQQRRIQMLILGFKGLSPTLRAELPFVIFCQTGFMSARIRLLINR